MQAQRRPRKQRGALIRRPNKHGGETWIGKWRAEGHQIQRTIGPVKSARRPDGLTRRDADRELGELIKTTAIANPSRPERRTLKEVGEALIREKRSERRKPSTLEAYESWLKTHIVPRFGVTDVQKLDRDDVVSFAAELDSKGLSPSSVASGLRVLHTLLEFAIREGWRTRENPVKGVKRPARSDSVDIRFLKAEEVEALLRATPDDALGRVEKVMYLTAAQTGLRQGELLGLRWRDVDWTARRIRVRQSYVRGEFGSPKSRRSSRSVPLNSRVGQELDLLSKETAYNRDDDLVFAHPASGRPIDRSKVLKRFKQSLVRAGVRDVRFHDLRHTYGTAMAQVAPLRTVQEWMGHRDITTTQIYADYAESEHEAQWAEQAFAVPVPSVAEAVAGE